jgi:hypothetical protein
MALLHYFFNTDASVGTRLRGVFLQRRVPTQTNLDRFHVKGF